jgi:S-adenosylmethionine:tRNA ribosyltransferase-isomerase
LLARLTARGVGPAHADPTLHVGPGSFPPVRVGTWAEHKIHSEWFEVAPETVSAIGATRAHRGRVVAVATTTLRAGARETDIFITPGSAPSPAVSR